MQLSCTIFAAMKGLSQAENTKIQETLQLLW